MSHLGCNSARKLHSAVLISLASMFALLSTAVASAQTEIFPAAVNFGNVAAGTASPISVVEFRNGSASSISITSIQVTPGGPYALATAPTNPCPNPGPLGAGVTCNIGVTLTPSGLGAQAADTLTIDSTAAIGGVQTISLNGTGSAATALSPSTEPFGSVVLNQASPVKTLTLYNYQPTSITVAASAPLPYAIAGGTCGATLAANSSCTITMTLTPTALGSVGASSLTVNTNAPNTPLTAALTGTGIKATGASPATLAFGNVVVGTPSASKSFTLSNNQTATPLAIVSIATPAGYTVDTGSPTACSTTTPVAPSSSCTITITLTPTSVGALPAGSVTVTTNAPDTPDSVALTGAGIAPATVAPTAVNFGNVVEGVTSPLHTVTLTNNQAVNLTVSSLAVTAGSPYAIDPSSSCLTPTVLPGASCTVALTITPTTVGVQPAGTLTITTNASNSPQLVPLSGTGLGAVTLAPSATWFSAVVIGTTSAPKSILLTNNQASPLSITSAVFNGPFALDANVAVTTCPQVGGTISGSLLAGQSCVIGVLFAPTATGATSGGQITVIDNASNSPQSAGLAGIGVVAASVAPTAIGFGNVVTGATSAAKTVTLTNSQSVALHFSSISAPAPFAVGPGTSGTPCVVGNPVAAGGACTLSVTFAPTALGAAASSLTFSDDAVNSPQSVTLSGSGVSAVSLPSSLNFGNVILNQATTKSVTLMNNMSVPLNISSISGFTGGYTLNAAGTTCSLTSQLPAGQPCTIAVTLTATTLGVQPAAAFTVTDSAASSPQTVNLLGGAIQPVYILPTVAYFPATTVGLPSSPIPVTLYNEQNVPLNIASATITGTNPSDFSVTSLCPTVPASVPPTSNCKLNLIFKPTASGTRTAMLTVLDDALNSPQTITLTGAGNAPVVVQPDTTQTFTAPVGTTSPYKTFTVTNEQTNVPLIFSPALLTGDFIQSATTCPIGGAGLGGTGTIASCTISVEFDPSIGGVRDGQLQVNDNALTSPQVVNLTGTGTSPLTILPASLSFSAQTVGTVSPAKTITLTNHETQSETFSVAAIGSLAAADYQANTNCVTGVIAAKSTCMIYVNFTPTSVTPSTTRGGTLTIANSAANGNAAAGTSPVTGSLTGSATSTPPAPSVASVSPGAGTTGTVVPVTITGNGWTHFSSSSTVTFVETNNTAIPCNIAVSAIASPNPNTINATLTLSGTTFGACNISVQSALSGGGTETASLISAFNIYENPGQSITGVTPAFGIQGQTLNVALTAVDTNFQQGVTIVDFGDGVTINSLTIMDPTDAVANITISNTTYIGYRTVTMQTDGEFAVSVLSPTDNPIFQIGPNSAALVSISPQLSPVIPTVVPQGFSGQLYLTATGTHFLENATNVSIGGVIVGDVNVTSLTTAVVEVAVPAGAPVGLQNATVSTGGEIASLGNAITIAGATPALVSVVPSSGTQGQSLSVVITGQYTNFTPGQISADFDGNISSPTVNVISPTQVSIPISIASDANVGSITANLLSGPAGSVTIFPFTFTVTASNASIINVSPTCVPQGGQLNLTVTGQNTLWATAETVAAFYPVPVPAPSFDEITINSPTSATLAVAVPTNTPAGAYSFYLATGGQVVSATMNVCAATPTLTMNPANGLLPTAPAVNQFTVNFTGQFTTWGPTTQPVIAGEGVTLSNFKVLSPLSASATLTIIASTNGTPTATGPRLVTLTTGGQIVTTYFNVTSTPVGIIALSPDNAPPSTTNLDVAILGLNTHFTSGVTQVLFGPQITVNSVTVIDDTHLTANISTQYELATVLTPTPYGWQTIYVNTNAEMVEGGFLVDSPALPSIVSVSPSSAAQGQSLTGVVITGSLTNWVQGTTEAILGNGISISDLTITSPTTATATIAVLPTAPVGGNSVVMYTGAQVVSGSGFSVTPSAAYIQSVEPNFTCPMQYTNDVTGFNCTPGSSPTGVPVVAQLQTVTLNIIGVGTHWLQGETTMNFGFGVVTDQLTISSPTTAQAQITVLSIASVGFSTLTVSTDGEVVYLTQAIDIEEGSPILLAFSPSSAEQGGSTTLQILGRFTHFDQGTTNVAFNQDITVNSINVIDSENMTANITVSPWAYVDFSDPCGHVLTVTTGNEQVFTDPPTLNNFCVSQGAEEITSVAPLEAIQGSTLAVTIVGSATNFVAGETQVSFGDANFAVGEINVIDSTHLTVPVAVSTSATTGFKTVTVTTLGQVASQQYSFTVEPGVGTLNEAIPNQAEQGAPLPSATGPLVVRLIGQYTHFDSSSTATFGAGITVQSIALISNVEVDATITIDPLSYVGGRSVTVTTPGLSCALQPVTANFVGCAPGATSGTGSEIVTANVFTIIPGPAIISNVVPNTGNEGQEVVFNISGEQTHWAQNFTQFYIAGGGSDLTLNSVVINSATSATVDMSISPTANPGARSIYMVTNGESLTDSGAFVVTGGVPVVTYISPNSQQNPSGGTTGLEVTIHGLYTQWATGATSVNFGPGITIEPGTLQIDNETTIEAVIDIAAGAQDGYRTVVVTTGTQGLTGNFQVTAPAPPPTPYIWYMSPGSALPGQTLTITFNGAYTDWQPSTGSACAQTGTTLTGAINPSITINCFQVLSPTSATANITIAANATASTSDLTLTTGPTSMYSSGEVENAQFSVVIAQPTLSIVDPGSGLQGSTNLTVDILGQYTTFDNTTTFTFGGINSGITTVGPPTILGPTIATQVINIDQLAPLGGVGVTALTPDAAPIAQTVTGAGFTVTPSLALIASVTPNTSAQGTNVTVIVTGQNTHWDAATTFQFGDGIVVTSTVVSSETSATLTLAIPAYAGEGPTSVSAHTGGEDANLNNAFVVTAGTPYLLSTGPGSAPQQGSVVFTILSQATTWTSAAPPVVSYGPYITLTNVNVTGPTSLTVDGFVQPTAPIGYYNLTVTTGTQQLGLNNAVYISPGPAVINSVTPSAADQAANIAALQIQGINTHWAQGTTALTFTNNQSVNPLLFNTPFVVNSPTSITANVTVNATAPAGQYNAVATTGGEVATGINVFTVSQSEPELLAVVPSSGPQGLTASPVTITGDFTNFVNGTTTANFGAGITVNSVTVTSATQAQANITVSPTTSLGYRNVSVATGTQVVNLNNAFQVYQGPAEIVGPLNPASGGEGHQYNVIVTGSQTHFAQNLTTASFGGGIQVTGVTVNSLLSATVSINIPSSVPTGAYNVVLTTGSEVATILGGFTVGTGTPQISIVSPPTGTQGITLNVDLTGQFTHWASGTSVATFGSGITVNTLTVTTPATAVANITISPTAAIASYTPTITTGAEVASITGGFSVLAGVPTLLTAAPGTAQAGTSANVVINGTFTNFQQAFTTVSFGSGVTVNLITVHSLTQLTANISVAANASVGGRTIQVNTNSQDLQLNGAFSVTAGTPVITQINPNIGTVGESNLNVTVTGLYTNWVSGTTTVSFGAAITVNTVTVNTPASLVANISVGSGAATGPYTVTTTTGGEVETVPGGFTVDPVSVPSPTLLSLSPGPSVGVMPINSVITAVFSQPMNRTTFTSSTVSLTLVSNPNGNISVPLTLSVDATGRVLTITPTGLLGVNSTYNLIMTGGIQDAAGTAFSYYSYDLYTVDSANTSPVTVIAANPPANTTVAGTNVPIMLEFSATMNQSTQAGMIVETGGNPVAGTISWNSNPYCCGTGWAQPGTVLTFTPASPLAANTAYTVSYGAPLADTAGNGVTPGSFNFTTAAAADTVTNNVSAWSFESGQTNLGTNFAPGLYFQKPINPIDINGGTLLVYNEDSGKYVGGAVTVAPNGLSAAFTPTYPLLPNTWYRLVMSGGYYDMDGNYLDGNTGYFTTGSGSDLTAPSVLSVSPANTATSVPLNAEVTVHFSAAISPDSVGSAITVTPSGGSAIAGTASLASDLVTFTFVPTAPLTPGTVFTVQVTGYSDMVGNAGTPFSSTFTSAASSPVLNVSTGLNAAGQLITANNTNDGHWVYIAETGTPSETTFGCASAGTGCTTGATAPLQTVGSGDTGFYGDWAANGPTSDWININPNSTAGNTFGLYYTTFNISGTVPTNQCLVGVMGVDDNGELAINGTSITGNISAIYSLTPINIAIPSGVLVTGTNSLSLGWGSTDNYDEAFRLGAVIETCGASYTGGLSLTSSTPANSSTGAATNTTITLNFNNNLDPATVNSATLLFTIGQSTSQDVAGAYQVNGNQVIFTPDSPLPISTTIWAYATTGMKDLAGDYINGQWILSFTTGSTAIAPSTAFHVTAFSPANGAINVGLRAPVTATFNRSVDPYSINPNAANADFGLFTGDSQAPWCGGGSYTRSQDNTTISFNCYPLPGSTVMTAALNSNLTDWTGDALTNFTSQFTTSYYDSNTNGTMITSRPGNSASGINVNEPLTLYFNLPINASTANNGLEVAQNNVTVPGSIQVLDNGYTIEFTPSVPWTQGALIQWWTTGALMDTTYNTPVTGASGYFFAAANTNTSAPVVQVASPSNGSTAAVNSIVDLQFNVPLNQSTVTTSSVYLYDQQSGLNVAGTYSFPQPNEIRIVPTANFTQGHYIYVGVTTAVQSTTSVPVASTNWVAYFYANNAADSTVPTVLSAVPYNGSTGIGVNIAPSVVVSKPIDPVSVNSNTFQVTNGGTPLAGSFYLNSTDTRVQFVPNAPLPANTNLTMTVNGILDVVNHPLNFTSSFTTGPGPDFIQPTVIWSSVTANESIPTNSMIEVRFSESMDVETFLNGQPGTCGNFYIQDELTNGCIATTLTWSADQSTAYLVPAQPLAAGREYQLAVSSGTDLAGNSMQNISTYFYAELGSSSSAPTVVAFNPLSGATGTGTNVIIEAQFSAPIDPTTIGSVTLKQGGSPVATTPVLGSGNTVLQLVPNVQLAGNTTYVMNIAGVKDPAGNTVATVTNTFTTGPTFDINPPAVVSSDPISNTTVGTNVNPKFLFNKPLNPLTVNSGTFRIYLNDADTNQLLPATVTLSSNGLEVTITPQTPLLPNTKYEFSGGWNGGPQDEDGNYLNLPWYYFTTNGGADTTGPTVSVIPANGATAVPLNAHVYVTVSAQIDPTTVTQNSVVVTQGGTPIAGTVTQPGIQTLVFTPAAALSPSTGYTVQVTGITDANGNAVVANSSTFTTGTVTAAGGLTTTSFSPVQGSDVTNSQAVTITFNQTINPATVNASTFMVTNGQSTSNGLAGTLTVNGAAITFTPSNPYPANTTIWVYITSAVTDLSGDAYSGNSWSLSFNTNGATADTTALTVLSVSPAAGAANVRPDTLVSVTFNKSISPSTAGGNNSLLFSGQGLEERGNIYMSADNRTLTFNLSTLYQGTAYTIQLPAGGITDMSGNALASTFSSTFTTGQNPATGNGSVQSEEPGANATGIPTNSILTLFMSRQVNTSTVTGQLSVTVNGAVYAGNLQTVADGYEIQYTPSSPFPAGATVQWFLTGNVLDLSGDPFYGNSGTFYTAPTVNTATAIPANTNDSPGSNASNIPTNSSIYLAFSQPLKASTLTTANVYLYDGNLGTYPAITVSQPEPNVIELTPASALVPTHEYYACANGSVQGTNGIATNSGCWDTYFNAGSAPDTTPGTVIIGPPNGSTGVGTNAYIRLLFSKPFNRAMFNAATTQNAVVSISGTPVPGSWSFVYNSSTNDAIGANFSPLNPLPPSTPVSVSVSGVLDYAGNTFTAASSSFTTGALPDYNQPTATLDFSGTAYNIGTNASFTCLYTEPMDPSSINQSNTHVWSQITNGFIPVTYTWASDLLSVTMTPTTPLDANSYYYYQCDGGIDLTGNGLGNSYAYFYTGNGAEAVGPTFVAANPPSGATNVPLNSIGGPWNNTSLMLLFNEPIATQSLSTVTFTPQGGSAEPIAVYAEDGNYIADVQLPWTLQPNTTYTFNFAGVTDVNGNPLTGASTSSFTTGSSFAWTNPTATAETPASGSTSSVNPVISVTFSELMNPVLFDTNHIYLRTHNTQTTVPTTLALSTVGGVTVATLTPVSPLAESTIYDVVYGSPNWYLYDVAGNYEGQTGIETTFTTGTTSAVNGVCGTANSSSFSAPPSTNLCSAGTASAITEPYTAGSYAWGWTCNGQYGGTNASCSATVSGAPACSAQLASLQGLWPGNDNANDLSPNGYNGTLLDGVTYALGEVGDAFNLSANSGTVDEYVLIGQPVPANLQIQSSITLSAWIYPTALPTDYGSGAIGIIAGSQHDGNYAGATLYYDTRINPDGNQNNIPPGHIGFNLGDGTTWYVQDTETQVPLNQWTLVTATGTSGSPSKVYFNGVLQPSNSGNYPSNWDGTVSYSGSWFAIGQEVNENRPFVGLINDVAVYNAALTPAQILAIYNAGSAGVCQ